MQRITKLDNDLTCKGMLMKLWNKTLLASALCLTLFGCDDASKVDNKLDKAKDNAEQMKDAAADKAQAIKQDADKQIDTLKSQADAEADRLKDQASAIKAEADKKADAIAQQAKRPEGMTIAQAFHSRFGRAGCPSPSLPSATAARRGSPFSAMASRLPSFQA